MIGDDTKATIAAAFGLSKLEATPRWWRRESDEFYATYIWAARLRRFEFFLSNAPNTRGIQLAYPLHMAIARNSEQCRGVLLVPIGDPDKTQFRGYLPLVPVDLQNEDATFLKAISGLDLTFQQEIDYMGGRSMDFSLYVSALRTKMDYVVENANVGESHKIDNIYYGMLDVLCAIAKRYNDAAVNEFLDNNDLDRENVYDPVTRKLVPGSSFLDRCK